LDSDFEVALWSAIPPVEKFPEAWRLTVEVWTFSGKPIVNRDFIGLLRELSGAKARFLVVGAYGVSFHSEPKAPGALDLWVEATSENAACAHGALRRFGFCCAGASTLTWPHAPNRGHIAISPPYSLYAIPPLLMMPTDASLA